MCVDNDTGVLIRREGAGFLIGFSDPRDPPSMETGFDPAFLDAIAARVGNRFPFLEDVPISPRKCWAGLYPETPGPPRHHRRTAAMRRGSSSAWVSAATGSCTRSRRDRRSTELITDGRCTTFDLHPLRLQPFRRAGGSRRDRGALSRSARSVRWPPRASPAISPAGSSMSACSAWRCCVVERRQRRSHRIVDRDAAAAAG